jgi:hypothetical protein
LFDIFGRFWLIGLEAIRPTGDLREMLRQRRLGRQLSGGLASLEQA